MLPLSEIILIIMVLLTVAMLSAALCRSLPDSAFRPAGCYRPVASAGWRGMMRISAFLLSFSLTPEIVLFLFLPVLVFESAFNLDARELVKDLMPVITLALPALLISTFLIGTGLWGLFGFDFTLMLLFGALISATDPVAVIALFKELGAPSRLTTLVEGESLFNDATAIVLFNTLLTLSIGSAIAWTDVGYAFLDFFRIFLGGVVLGAAIGLLISMVLNRFHAGYNAFLIMSVVMAYISFILAEHVLHLSGVMAVVGSALVLAAYGVARIPQETSQSIRDVWEVLAIVSNSLLFMLVGLSINVTALNIDAVLIITAVILVLAARAVVVYGFLPTMIRLFDLPHVALREQHIMWWGGLKGGLAIAIALTIPEDMPGRGLVLDLTLAVVLFSLLLNAPTIRPLIVRLGMDRMSEDDAAEWRLGLDRGKNYAERFLQRFQQLNLLSGSIRAGIQDIIRSTFRIEKADDVQEHHRRLRSLALREEMAVLRELYSVGLIKPYTFLDLRNTLRRDSERMKSQVSHDNKAAMSLFQRIESWGLTHLREHDWATLLLARYQKLRLSLRLERDIAALMMAKAALDVIWSEESVPDSERRKIETVYEDRYGRRGERLQQLAHEYPDYYRKSLERLALQSSLVAAREGLEEDHHHGAIGAKAFSRLQQRLWDSLQRLPEVPPPRLQGLAELMERVPLLHGLSAAVRHELVAVATIVTFLPEDQVIAQGQRGDALYIILSGKVIVSQQQPDGSSIQLAELVSGDFFGETALLEERIRTASIHAKTTATLIRIPRREVLRIAQILPELRQRLAETAAERREGNTDTDKPVDSPE
ncbi:MAG: cation:proton antiporter [Gammaproteobacteria bacterium]|nr:cation:proton antiporter [Gammaproteobacteria bacterium]